MLNMDKNVIPRQRYNQNIIHFQDGLPSEIMELKETKQKILEEHETNRGDLFHMGLPQTQ